MKERFLRKLYGGYGFFKGFITMACVVIVFLGYVFCYLVGKGNGIGMKLKPQVEK